MTIGKRAAELLGVGKERSVSPFAPHAAIVADFAQGKNGGEFRRLLSEQIGNRARAELSVGLRRKIGCAQRDFVHDAPPPTIVDTVERLCRTYLPCFLPYDPN